MTIIQEMGKSYLIVDDMGTDEEEYAVRMLTDNHIPGIIPCRRGLYQNREVLKYDITNMKNLASEYVNRSMRFKDISGLLYGIAGITATGASYLLEERFYVYHPEMIYTDMEYNRLHMIYIPFSCKDNERSEGYRALSDYMLEKLDHTEESAVNIAYQFYRMSKEELFSLRGFCSLIDRESTLSVKEDKAEDIRKTERVANPDQEEEACVYKPAEEEKEKSIKVPVTAGVIGAILTIFYFLIGRKSDYASFILMAVMSAMAAALFLTVRYMMWSAHKRKEDELAGSMPQNRVTVNEFWGGDEKTVFFDEQTRFFDEEQKPAFSLKWIENGKEKVESIRTKTALIGKKYDEVDICIPDPTVSRKHVRMKILGDSITIEDLGSTNGTYVDGRKLSPGEEISIIRNQDFMLGKVPVSVV